MKKDLLKNEQKFQNAVNSKHININHDINELNGIKIGDVVMIKNGFDIEVGPFKVLGFSQSNKMYLNWDCWWFPISINRVIKVIENNEE